MIKINLLPSPRARKGKRQWDVRFELLAGVVIVLLSVATCFYYSASLDSDIQAKELEKQQKNTQKKVLEDKVKQVQNFEQKKKELEEKNRVIDQLEKSRAGPVRVLDYVSQSLEPLNLWLVRLTIKGNVVELEGKALTNDDVVEFLNNLKRADYFSSIKLLETRSGNEGKISTYQFRVTMSLKA
jgi:type IV pilus assembly protein PilN